MSPDKIRELLAEVKAGRLDVDVAVDELAQLPFRDIGVATVDHHRALRQGTPEVIFGAGKSAEQLLAIGVGDVVDGLRSPERVLGVGQIDVRSTHHPRVIQHRPVCARLDRDNASRAGDHG